MDLEKIMSIFEDTNILRDLIKAENQINNEDGAIEFENDTTHLKLNVTDNGIQMSYSYEDATPNLRDEFTEFCDTIDNDFFDEVCETYTAIYGEGSLKKLNDSMDTRLIKQFYAVIEDVASEKMAQLAMYRNGASEMIDNL